MKQYLLGGVLVIVSGTMVIAMIPGGFLRDAAGFGGAGEGVYAKVGDQEVTVQELQQRSQQALRRSNYPSALLPFIRTQVAQQLVSQKAMMVEASRLGLHVTDDELRDELRNGPYGPELFPGGNFIGQERYDALVLQATGMSVGQFEDQYKEQLLLRKLRNLLEDGVSVSNKEIEAEYRREGTKVKLEYAVLSMDNVSKNIHPNEAELKAFFEQNQARYADAIPEKRKADYVVINTAKLAEQLPITREDLQQYYNQHRDEFRVADEVNLRLIQVRMPPAGADGKPDPKAVEAARQKAEDIGKKLKGGANFADLAKKMSDDPSKENGGDLGWIGRGRIPDIEDQIFALNKGQTSGVLQSSLGFNIVRVEDKRTAHTESLDDVKARIEPLIRQEKAVRAAESMSAGVRNLARSANLETAAAKNGLQVLHSEWFSRGDALPGIGPAPEFMDAVFAAHANDPPDGTTTAQGYVVYKLTEVKPPEKPTFEAVRSRVESEFKQQRASEQLQKQTQELADRAHASHDLKKAAKELGATVKTSELVDRTGQVPDIGSLAGQAAVAFDMKIGDISGPVNSGRNGVVFTVLERQEPSPEKLSTARDRVRDSLLRSKREEVFEIFVFNLQQQMEKAGRIRYNKQEREKLLNPRPEAAGGY
jgi:peptidyl-prolyl cis-trans isomerase D